MARSRWRFNMSIWLTLMRDISWSSAWAITRRNAVEYSRWQWQISETVLAFCGACLCNCNCRRRRPDDGVGIPLIGSVVPIGLEVFEGFWSNWMLHVVGMTWIGDLNRSLNIVCIASLPYSTYCVFHKSCFYHPPVYRPEDFHELQYLEWLQGFRHLNI